jgi:DNA-directed RNA polymerase specialized sigma24 family protein
MERAEERAIARRAIEALTERDRAFVLMRADGLGYDDIATHLSVERDSVGTTLARARKRLVERFEALKRGREALGRVAS